MRDSFLHNPIHPLQVHAYLHTRPHAHTNTRTPISNCLQWKYLSHNVHYLKSKAYRISSFTDETPVKINRPVLNEPQGSSGTHIQSSAKDSRKMASSFYRSIFTKVRLGVLLLYLIWIYSFFPFQP